MGKTKILIFLFLALTSTILAQLIDTSKAGNEFNNALKLYNSNKFHEAQQLFSDIITRYEFNSYTTIAYIFDAKSFIGLKVPDAALKILREFINRFQDSKYVNEAKLTLAQALFDQHDYLRAFNELCNLIDSTSSEEYIRLAKRDGEKIALNFLSADQIKQVYDSSGIKSKPFILLEAGKIYLQNNNKEEAEKTFAEIINLYKDSEEKSDAAVLYEQASFERQKSIKSPIIAVLLPLKVISDIKVSQTISEILEGIKFSADGYNKNHKEKIGLLILNTERDKNQIIKIRDEINSIPTVKAIIGPVYSDEVKETLEAFKNTGIPIISPTATDDSLTNIYPDFFQANPSFSERGEIMAEYIYYVENKKVMGVLNSTESYAPLLADAFIKRYKSLGGQILIRQTYSDYDTAFDKAVSKIAADSSELSGVYIPLAGNLDVTLMLSDFVKYNFNLPLYGNQDWFSAKGFETYPELSNKLTFTSDYFLDYSDSVFENFENKFSNQTNLIVNRNVLYGYDAAEYLFNSIKNFDENREAIKNDLISKTIYHGFHNYIYFNKSRLNKFLNIVRYKDGTFQIVDKFKLSN